MSKGRILSVRLRNSQLMGVIDLLEIHLQQELSIALSTNIVTLLDIVINKARSNGDIPFYENEDDAGLILQDKVRFTGKHLIEKEKLNRHVQSTESVSKLSKSLSSDNWQHTDMDFSPIVTPSIVSVENINSNYVESGNSLMSKQIERNTNYAVGTPFDDLEDVFAEVLGELQVEEEIALRAKLGLGTLTKGVPLETARIERTVSAVDKEDKRLKTDTLYNKSSETEKDCLRIIYHNLPHSEWSGDKAIELLQSMLFNLSK